MRQAPEDRGGRAGQVSVGDAVTDMPDDRDSRQTPGHAAVDVGLERVSMDDVHAARPRPPRQAARIRELSRTSAAQVQQRPRPSVSLRVSMRDGSSGRTWVSIPDGPQFRHQRPVRCQHDQRACNGSYPEPPPGSAGPLPRRPSSPYGRETAPSSVLGTVKYPSLASSVRSAYREITLRQ